MKHKACNIKQKSAEVSSFKPQIPRDRGISLYFAIVILSVLSAALLALITISISQIKIIHTLGNSVTSFYVADTGIEHCLYRIRKLGNSENFSGSFNGDSHTYNVTLTPAGSDCNAVNFCINSIGEYKKTKRVIEATY